MAFQSSGGAGGAGSTQSGVNGGNEGQPGGGSAAGTPPGGDGADASEPSDGGGGGADGSLAQTYYGGPCSGGRGGNGGGNSAGDGQGFGGGGGGGGGAGLLYGMDLTVTSGSLGGRGGDGGFGVAIGNAASGNGGGGGGGGDGLVLTDSGHTVTIASGATVAGGAGGRGGNSNSGGSSGSIPGLSGAGGAGGDGMFAYDGTTVVNAGVIEGGSGGAAGAGGIGGANGAQGAYGVGIAGSNLSVTNTGTIAGGFDSAGIVRGFAVKFTSGSNVLTLSSGGKVGAINGDIGVSGSLDVRSGGTASTLSGGLLVFGAAATAVTIESGVTLKDDVSGFIAGDAVDFRAVAYSTKLEAVFTASATGGTLHVVDSTHPTVTVTSVSLLGSHTSGVFGLSSDGNGGTKIGFAATPSLGMQPNDIATSSIPGSSALVVVDRYNADYSLYQEDRITKASNGNYTFHFAGGSFFNGKPFQSFDNVTNSAGLLLNQTLYDASGNSTEYTTFNANGTIYQQALISRPAAGQILYKYNAGTFFAGKPYSAFDNLATTGGTLLDQILYNRDGSHTFTVPGSNLTLTAQQNDTFNVSGQNDTTRFNATGFKTDVFNGYKAGDIFSFSTSIFANYTALSQHLSGTSSAVITDTSGDTLTLANVAKSSVNSSMFTFG